MDKSISRRNFMNFKMKNVGLNNYLYFSAIDGKKSKSYNDYENYCRKNHHKILTGDKGAFGCLLSYQMLFNHLLTEEINSCLVIEDDVYFHKKFKENLNNLYLENIFDQYDLIYFGYNNYYLSTVQQTAIQTNQKYMPVSEDRKFITCGTYAIWYSLKAIQKLSDKLNNLDYSKIVPIDHIVWKEASKLKSTILNPPLCISEIRDSDIRMSRNMHGFWKKKGFDLQDYMNIDQYENFM